MTSSLHPTGRIAYFISASGITNLADGISLVVWAWLATLLTREPLVVALLPVAIRLPWFLFSLPAGIITDRTDRRRLILLMDLLRASAFFIATCTVWFAFPLAPPPAHGIESPGVFGTLVFCAFLVGTAEVFRDNAAQTMLPTLVEDSQLERANGRLWSVELLGNALIGPALGSLLISWMVWAPFALNTSAFVLAALIMYSLSGTFRPASPAERNWRKELKDGLLFLKDASLLRLLALTTGVWNLFHQAMFIGLVLHVQENLRVGAKGYGLILATGALGGILGGAVADRIVSLLGPGRTAQWMTLGSALAFAGVALAPNGYALGLALATFEFTALVWNTVSVSYRQRLIPDALLGRVNSVYRLLAWGMMPIGLLLSGVLVSVAELYLPRSDALMTPFIFSAAGAGLLTILAWRPLGQGLNAAP
jgi:MFS family permease